METRHIAELLGPFLETQKAAPDAASHALSETQLNNISMYIDILLRWNARINLTAIRDPEEIVTRHFGESLFLARKLVPEPSSSASLKVADVGSGAGFPGLPLKIWAPEVVLTLIEANTKKATFLKEVCRALKLEDVQVLSERAETIAPESFDLVTMRAVERFSSSLPTAARLVRPGGRLAILVSKEQTSARSELAPGLRWAQPLPVPMSQSRVLAVGAFGD